MKAIKFAIAFSLLAMIGIGNALADHRGHVHFGVTIGPYWGPWYYPPPYYYYPPLVVERPVPQVYIEQPMPAIPQAAPPTAAAPANYWHYCAASKGYYPYVKECPGGWQKVLPQPPGSP